MFPVTAQPDPVALWDFAVGTAILVFSTGARSRAWSRAFRFVGYAFIAAGVYVGLER